MCYLDFPRINFSGQFTTGPSTINNTPANYNAANAGSLVPGWNPDGNAFFQLQGCTVQTVVTSASGPTASELDGTPVASTDNWGGSGVPAKIVDLDPEQQMVSMLYGLQLKFGSGDNTLVGDMTPMWFQNFFGATASYQSVLTNLRWGSQLTGALAALHAHNANTVSIRFFLGPGGPSGTGPMTAPFVGTIGPADDDAPINFIAGRQLRPAVRPGAINYAPAQVIDDSNGEAALLTLDLGASVVQQSLSMAVTANDAKHGDINLGTVNLTPDNRTQQASIFDLDLSHLSAADKGLLKTTPIVVSLSPMQVLLEEADNGIYVNASPYVLRMEANSKTDVQIFARRFGAKADISIDIIDDSQNILPKGSNPPPAVGRVGPNGSLVSFPNKVATVGGIATLTINGGNPDDFRQYIDGQVYALRFLPSGTTTPWNPKAVLSLLVHDAFDKQPTWENIQPIMSQYAVLYPVMKSMGIDLGDRASLIHHKSALLHVFSLPLENPAYMPVVRDLSKAKQDAIVAWLNAQT
jgi:hypothetical protein